VGLNILTYICINNNELINNKHHNVMTNNNTRFDFCSQKDFEKFTNSPLVTNLTYSRLEWVNNICYCVYKGTYLRTENEFWIKG